MSAHSRAKVEDIHPLTDSIVQLILSPETYIDYEAGQYLQIILDGEPVCYSIANAALGAHKYELHIRHSADNLCNQRLFSQIKTTGYVDICMPYGQCSLAHLDPNWPILFIAGGTGFAPIKAMIEQLLFEADARVFELFWGARLKNDLYFDEKIRDWQTHVSQFHYFSSVSEAHSPSLINHLLAKHGEDLARWQIVISGPFDMVYHMRDVLVAHGALPERLFSDAFDFEKNKE